MDLSTSICGYELTANQLRRTIKNLKLTLAALFTYVDTFR